MEQYVTYRNGRQVPEEREALIRPTKNKNWKNYVFISNKNWTNHDLPELCLRIDEWNLSGTLWLESNTHPQIIKDISDIKFKYLRSLNVSNNELRSCEVLSRTMLPMLEILYLVNNKITKIRTLRKSQTRLKILGLSNKNHICDVDSLCQLHSVGNFEEIILQNGFDVKEIDSDIKWLTKMQAKNIMRVCKFLCQNRYKSFPENQ